MDSRVRACLLAGLNALLAVDMCWGQATHSPEVIVWENRYIGNVDEVARGAAADFWGNTYWCGSFGDESGRTGLVLKYDWRGELCWERTFDFGSHGYTDGISVAVRWGSVYAAFTYLDGEEGLYDYDWMLVKLNSRGDTVWMRNHDAGVGGRENECRGGVLVTRRGMIYLSGIEYSGGTENILIACYDRRGRHLWDYLYDTGYREWVFLSRLDRRGYPVIVGFVVLPETSDDYLTMRINPRNGKPLWVSTWNSPHNKLDRAEDVTFDWRNNMYVAGWSRSPDGDRAVALKYSQRGDLLWESGWLPAGLDYILRMGTDRRGNIIAAGASEHCEYVSDAFWLVADKDFHIKALDFFDYKQGSNEPWAMAIDWWGHTYLSGFARDPDNGNMSDLVILRYNPVR